MIKKRTFFTILLSLTLIGFTNAQIGGLIKNSLNKKRVKDKIAKKLNEAKDSELEKARAELDSTSFNYAISLNDNAGLFETDSKGDYILRLVTNRKDGEQLTPEDRARRNLSGGELAYAKSKFRMAGSLFRNAKFLFETEGLTDSPDYYKTLANIGLLASTMSRYSVAEKFTTEALDLRRNSFGENHQSYAASLNNLAVLQKETGKYNDAERNIKIARRVLENTLGKEVMPVAIAINNEAMLYQELGRYQDAEKTMLEAISISEKNTNEKSGNHQKFLTNLALLYQQQGKYQDAEDLFKKLIKLKENRFGSTHEDYAHMQKNLAGLYMEMNELDEVEPLLKNALEIYQKKFGENHQLYAGTLHDLGNFYRYTERYEEAKYNLQRAEQISKQQLGDNHPDYTQLQEDVAILLWKTGEILKSDELYRKSLDQSLDFIQSYFPAMSEAEKTKYWDKLRLRFERYYAFALDNHESNPELINHMFNYHITTKGILLRTTNRIKQEILQSGDQDLIDLFLTWVDQKETLVRYYAYSKDELIEQKINLDSIERAANATEKELSAKSNLFDKEHQLSTITYNQVKEKLKSDEAAVEVVKVRTFDQQLTDQVQYAAMILKRELAAPKVVVIDNGNQLESRYFKYYNNVIRQKLNDDYSYGQYWAPIEIEVAGKRQVYFAPDGIYNQVNINILRDPNGKYPIEKFDISIIGNLAELVREQSSSTGSKEAVLYGNPDFGTDAVNKLPGTQKEINAVSGMLKSKGYKATTKEQQAAKESDFKNIRNPRILHVATHGYFLKDDDMRKGKVFGIQNESAKDNPLLRSGLLLANAGQALSDERTAALEGTDNGILTAYEASNLRLQNTELVVLSACETATGDIKSGEGVYGLQRAFFVAGTKAMIMSLWKVDDDATQKLMTAFYRYWLNGDSKKVAFKKAQLNLKKEYAHPYFWGAFILVEG